MIERKSSGLGMTSDSRKSCTVCVVFRGAEQSDSNRSFPYHTNFKFLVYFWSLEQKHETGGKPVYLPRAASFNETVSKK